MDDRIIWKIVLQSIIPPMPMNYGRFMGKNPDRILGSGIRGRIRNFDVFADVLCEDIGFIYASIIKGGKENTNDYCG